MKKILFSLFLLSACMVWTAEKPTDSRMSAIEKFHEQLGDEGAESIANRLKELAKNNPHELLPAIADAVKEDALTFRRMEIYGSLLPCPVLEGKFSTLSISRENKRLAGFINLNRKKEFQRGSSFGNEDGSCYAIGGNKVHDEDPHALYCVALPRSCFDLELSKELPLYCVSIAPEYYCLLQKHLTNNEMAKKIFAPFTNNPEKFVKNFPKKAGQEANDQKYNAADDDDGKENQ